MPLVLWKVQVQGVPPGEAVCYVCVLRTWRYVLAMVCGDDVLYSNSLTHTLSLSLTLSLAGAPLSVCGVWPPFLAERSYAGFDNLTVSYLDGSVSQSVLTHSTTARANLSQDEHSAFCILSSVQQ